MKFYKKSLLFLVPMLFMLLMMNSCNSCSNKKDEPKGPQPTEFEEAMTAKDTTAVKQLVDQFFSYVKEKNFSEAAGMLYRNDEDPNHEPQQRGDGGSKRHVGVCANGRLPHRVHQV